MNKVRCAIYTRKSSEEGLEQSFNSLHAQREACAAYILSQASEGWTLLPDQYDDGGISGGTLNRPALQRLLADIAAGKIDIVVVYKVDRLTRSLMDFSTLVQSLDAAGTSFVSVTQSFNTTTSMGRLTLNMLLSFAQFEREVTAERIRDKIAASKAKGMWMGGTPPIGYRPNGRTLAVVEEHAAIIRTIFERYLETASVFELRERLEQERIFTPSRQLNNGNRIGGIPFSRGQLYKIITNRIYLGEIPHKDQSYPGQHEGIVAQELWDRVQQRLAERTRGGRQPRVRYPSLLKGIIFDPDGQLMIASHANKGTRRYRYYISRGLQDRDVPMSGPGLRIPAREIESAVLARLSEALDNPLALLASAGFGFSNIDLNHVHTSAAKAAAQMRAGDKVLLRRLLLAVRMTPDDARLVLSLAVLADLLSLPPSDSAHFEVALGAKLSRSGRAMRLVRHDGHRSGGASVDEPLVRLVVKAHRWWARLRQGDIHVAALAREEGVTRSYISNGLRIAFLSPRTVEAIVGGRQPAGLSAQQLMQTSLPYCWAEQQATLA